jgi:hypothetical protein
MTNRGMALALGVSLGLVAHHDRAHADSIARYDCTVVGTIGQEPIGDRPGHMLVSFQYACFGLDGLMKGALYTAHVASEWENQKGTDLYGGGIHRTNDGYAVIQMTEAAGSVVMGQGMPAVSEARGKVLFKLASGRFAALAGRMVDFTAKMIGPGHFIYEMTD